MNRRWLIALLGILAIVTVYEIFNNQFSVFMLLLGVVTIFLRPQVDGKSQNTLLIVSLIAFALALISSQVLWLVLIVFFVLIIGAFPEAFQTIRQVITEKKDSSKETEFVMVQFNEEDQNTGEISKNRWIGDDIDSTEDIYSWEDINFSKALGNTIFDLGNTILRKEQNIILIRKGIGNTKLIIPKGVAVSLDISMLFGKLAIQDEEILLRNETFKWKSENYDRQNRKIKLITNVLVGEVEVVFL